LFFLNCVSAFAQAPQGPPFGNGNFPPDGGPGFDGPPPFGAPGFGRGGPGGPGMMRPIELVPRFDKDADGRLNSDERKAAREFIKQQRSGRRMGPGPGGFGGPRRGPGDAGDDQAPVEPGPKVKPSDVKSFPDAAIYDATTVRTFFLEFEDADW